MELLHLEGKKGLIVGVANKHSIAWGCAKIFHQAGASIALTHLNDKAKPFVEPLAQEISCPIFLPCDVTNDQQMQDLFAHIAQQWGKLDFLIHSIAYAPLEDLHGRVVDSSKEGFCMAMDISCHSFLRMAKLAEPLMKDGGSLITMSYYGSEKVIPHYNMMGPVKAALESCTRYLAVELGEKNIRVNAISPGPIATRAASGINQFDNLLNIAGTRAPLRHNISLEDIGNLATFLVSDLAKNITGGIHYVDCGYEVVG